MDQHSEFDALLEFKDNRVQARNQTTQKKKSLMVSNKDNGSVARNDTSRYRFIYDQLQNQHKLPHYVSEDDYEQYVLPELQSPYKDYNGMNVGSSKTRVRKVIVMDSGTWMRAKIIHLERDTFSLDSYVVLTDKDTVSFRCPCRYVHAFDLVAVLCRLKPDDIFFVFFFLGRIYDGTIFKNDLQIWKYFSKHLLPLMNPNCKFLPNSTMLAFAIYLFKHLAGKPVEECPTFVNVEGIRMGVALMSSESKSSSSSSSSPSVSSASSSATSCATSTTTTDNHSTTVVDTSADSDLNSTNNEIEIFAVS